jgi:hypothetical protein
VIGVGHPWEGFSGVICGQMVTPVGLMFKVRLDNGVECGAKDKHISAPRKK